MRSIAVAAKISLPFLSVMLLLLSLKCGGPAVANSYSNKTGVTAIVSEKQFNELFPMRDKFYTYTAFIKAANDLSQIKIKVVKRTGNNYQFTRTDLNTGKSTIIRQDADWNEDWAKKKPDSTYVISYGNFCSENSLQINKKELAAFFAQIAHETRHGQDGEYNDGLMFLHENDTSNSYVAPNDAYPAVPGKKYYGRGPMELSYNGNYGYASDCIFGDKRILLNNPQLVATDAVVAFKTAIYFWMTSQALKPSAHNVMTGKWRPNAADKAAGRVPGFGMTINIVNGNVECNKGENNFGMKDRIGFYQHFLQKLGVSDPNCPCSCGKMKPF